MTYKTISRSLIYPRSCGCELDVLPSRLHNSIVRYIHSPDMRERHPLNHPIEQTRDSLAHIPDYKLRQIPNLGLKGLQELRAVIPYEGDGSDPELPPMDVSAGSFPSRLVQDLQRDLSQARRKISFLEQDRDVYRTVLFYFYLTHPELQMEISGLLYGERHKEDSHEGE